MKLVLIQGDCLKVLPTLPDNSVDLVLTDPPYNIGKAKWDNVDLDFYRKWLKECTRIVKHTILTFCSHIFIKDIRKICEDELGLTYRMLLIWDWRQALPFRPKKNYTTGYDSILFFTKSDDYTFNKPTIYSEQWNILKFPRAQINTKEGRFLKDGKVLRCHPTQKPEKLIEHLIKIHSNPNDTILDPFLGSGTTMKVARDLKRSCIGIEINPEYVEIAKKRLEWGSNSFSDVEWEFIVM